MEGEFADRVCVTCLGSPPILISPSRSACPIMMPRARNATGGRVESVADVGMDDQTPVAEGTGIGAEARFTGINTITLEVR